MKTCMKSPDQDATFDSCSLIHKSFFHSHWSPDWSVYPSDDMLCGCNQINFTLLIWMLNMMNMFSYKHPYSAEHGHGHDKLNTCLTWFDTIFIFSQVDWTVLMPLYCLLRCKSCKYFSKLFEHGPGPAAIVTVCTVIPKERRAKINW